MVHMKSLLVTIVSAKTKYYEKLNKANKVTFIVLIIVLIKISIRIRPNTN